MSYLGNCSSVKCYKSHIVGLTESEWNCHSQRTLLWISCIVSFSKFIYHFCPRISGAQHTTRKEKKIITKSYLEVDSEGALNAEKKHLSVSCFRSGRERDGEGERYGKSWMHDNQINENYQCYCMLWNVPRPRRTCAPCTLKCLRVTLSSFFRSLGRLFGVCFFRLLTDCCQCIAIHGSHKCS